MSWSTDLSPTAIFSLGHDPCSSVPGSALPVGGAGEVYPGCGTRGGAGRAIPGYYPDPTQYPYLVIF